MSYIDATAAYACARHDYRCAADAAVALQHHAEAYSLSIEAAPRARILFDYFTKARRR